MHEKFFFFSRETTTGIIMSEDAGISTRHTIFFFFKKHRHTRLKNSNSVTYPPDEYNFRVCSPHKSVNFLTENHQGYAFVVSSGYILDELAKL